MSYRSQVRILAAAACLTVLSAEAIAQNIGYSKLVYNKGTTAPGDTTGEWTSGNAGSNYLENQWAYYQYMITGITTVAPSFDVSYNHYQPGTNAVFVDAFANFRACLDCPAAAGARTTGTPGLRGMLRDGIPFPDSDGIGDDTLYWKDASGAISNINRPFNGTCLVGEDLVNTPTGDHCFSVDGAKLQALFPGTTWSTGHTITLFYAAHMAAASVWSLGNESLLGCSVSANYVAPFPATMPNATAYGTDAYSAGDICVKGDNADDWTAAFNGVGAASGSSRHFQITNQTAGPQGGLTLPIPTVPAISCPPEVAGNVCCTAGGLFQPAGTPCRAAVDVCDVPEVCSGSTPTCPADVVVVVGTQCRADGGICDVAEFCNGVSGFCPANGSEPNGTLCRASSGVCDVAETCLAGVCPSDGFQPVTTECRADAGLCDVPDFCNGAGQCSADGKEPQGTLCRAQNGFCDVQEVCNGTTSDCPADGVVPAAQLECRADTGSCDVPELCDGINKVCPADGFEPASVVCRGDAGVCDVEERCTGSSASCPTDGFEPVTTECRTDAGLCDVPDFCNGAGQCSADGKEPQGTLCRTQNGFCDVQEVCDGTTSDCPADGVVPAAQLECRADTGSCDVPELCDGINKVCPADGFEPASVVCRGDAGVCDVEERCTGSSASCPTDGFEPVTTECRADAGLCDVPDFCNGEGQCAADGKEPLGKLCRTSGGVCDVEESCNGTTNDCPADVVVGTSPPVQCRQQNGICDVPENCDGAGKACPADTFVGAGQVCNPKVDTLCDIAETCTGRGPSCPQDTFEPTTTVCRAAGGFCDLPENCTGQGTCAPDLKKDSGTVCNAGNPAACDPAEVCSGSSDVCPPNDPGEGCPAEACRTVGYWGTHGGDESGPNRNITQMTMNIAAAALQTINVCGEVINNTNLDWTKSAIEGLCDSGGGKVQLARQLIALSLNCISSQKPADCVGSALFGPTFAQCNDTCQNGNGAAINLCIPRVDCLNNGGTLSEAGGKFLCATGTCSNNQAPCSSGNLSNCAAPVGTEVVTCNPNQFTCHQNPILFADAPASSPNKCEAARKTPCDIFTDNKCGTQAP